jgi:hypothetical protein
MFQKPHKIALNDVLNITAKIKNQSILSIFSITKYMMDCGESDSGRRLEQFCNRLIGGDCR